MSTEKTLWFHAGEPVMVLNSIVHPFLNDAAFVIGTVFRQSNARSVTVQLVNDFRHFACDPDWVIPMLRASVGDLHTTDYGVHVQNMEEWNEGAGFVWGPASIHITGDLAVITQTDGIRGVVVATYDAGGEGDLYSLRVYGQADPDDANGPCGHEYYTLGRRLNYKEGRP